MPWIQSRETCLQKWKKIRFPRVEVDVYPRGGTFKHTAEWGKSKLIIVIRMCQHMEVWFLYVIIDYPIQIDIILRWNCSLYICII